MKYSLTLQQASNAYHIPFPSKIRTRALDILDILILSYESQSSFPPLSQFFHGSTVYNMNCHVLD